MNIATYYFRHAIPTGWQTIGGAFRAWKDLLTGNWEPYALLSDDDPYEECKGWFWQLLGEDNVYPKAFLEDLYELIEKIESNDQELITMTLEDLATLDRMFPEKNNGDV